MRSITISASTHDLLREHGRAMGMNMIGGVIHPDGRVQIVVDEEVFVRLEALSPGDPDAALRTLCTPGGVGRA